MESQSLAQQAGEHAVLFLVGQLILFILTLVGALAIGRRFIDKEYPGFVQRVESGMSTLKTELFAHTSSIKSELLSEIDELRRDVIGLSKQFVDHQIESTKQTKDVMFLDRRVNKLEDRFDSRDNRDSSLDDTQPLRRRKTDRTT